MKAIIMAGGEGTRLRPLTCDLPKPMVPVMNRPVMEHIISLLKKHSITDIGVTLQYLPAKIKDYFGDGKRFGVSLQYFIEETPLGTAGSVKNAESFLDDDFIVISGDSLTDIDLSAAIDFHHQNNAAVTLVLKSMDVPLEYGVVITNQKGQIERFVEKPDWSEVFSDTVNTGTYILKRNILDKIPTGEQSDFAKDLFPLLLSTNEAMYGYVASGYWCDIGDLDMYRRCHFDIFDGKVIIDLNSTQRSPGVFVEEGVIIEDGAIINAPVYIGANSVINKGATLNSYSAIGANTTVGSGSSLKRCVLWDGCSIGRGVELRGSILCSKVVLKDGVSVFEQSIIGSSTIVNNDVIINPSIKIWPFKQIEAGTVVSANLIWGTKHISRLFGYKGIAGELNVDITPEFASRLGAAFGTVGGKKIALANDGTKGAEMLSGSFTSGLLSSGVEVHDLGEQPLPITRSAVRFYGLDGGLHISTKGESVDLDFLDLHGANIDRPVQKKLESLFMREDFMRCEAARLSSVTPIFEYKVYYLREIINSVQNKKMGYKLLISESSEWGQRLAASATADLGCEAEIRFDELSTDGIDKFASDVRMGFDLGAILDDSCENLTLIDERGRLITGDFYLLFTALITMKTHTNANIFAPISAPLALDRLANKYGAAVKRTKQSLLALMGEISREKNPAAHMQFLMNFDAVGALITTLDYMKRTSLPLSAIADEIPQFFMTTREVECSFDEKGRVMKGISAQSRGRKVELTDGVKLSDENGWVLIMPDAIRPIFRIIGEGYSEEYANELTDFYAARVQELIEG